MRNGPTYLFLCMSIISMVIICLGITLSACTVNAQGIDTQDEAPPAYQLELIITSAFRESEAFFSSVEQITAQELRQQGVTTVAEALDLLPGLRTGVARVGHGSYVSLRGCEQQNLLIVVNDVPLYTPYDGLLELDQLPVDQIQSIRVIKGSAPLHYGPNHLGGVIHIITRESSAEAMTDSSPPSFGDASAFLSQNGTYGLRLGTGWRQGSWRLSLSGSRDRSDGFPLTGDYQETAVPELPGGQSNLSYENGSWRDNSDRAGDAAHMNASYVYNDRWRIDLSTGLVDNSWGIPPHPIYNPEKNKSRVRYWRFEEWKQTMLDLTASGRAGDRTWLQAGFFYNTYKNTLDGYDDDTYSSQEKPYAFHSIYDDHVLGGRFRLDVIPGRIGRMTVSAGLTEDVHHDTPDRGAPTDEYRHRTWWCSLEDQVSLSTGVSLDLGCAGSFLEKLDAAGDPDPGQDLTALDPRLSLAAAFFPSVRFYVTGASLSRFPTMKQLYGVDGNPDLKTQRSVHIECGGRWTPLTELQIRGSVFVDRVTDLIEGNYTAPTLLNVSRADFTGLEASLQADPFGSLHGRLSYQYLQARNRSDDRPGDELQYRPEHQLDWDVRTDLPFQVRFYLSGSAISERSFYNDFYDGRRDRLASYVTVDATIRKTFSFGLELFAGVKNLFDADYSHVFSSPAPGRQVRSGFDLSW